jgi:AraC family transcriptional regulator
MLSTETYFLKNMVCDCCIILLKKVLEENDFIVNNIQLGEVSVSYNQKSGKREKLLTLFRELNLEPVQTREQIIVEKIKLAVIELIHELNNVSSIIRKSDYLVGKMSMSYQYLSKLFSEHEPVTLEKYIILQKIERIKELVDAGELNYSEIAYIMDYSSVHYLSSQFKNITGMTLTEYSQSNRSSRKSLNNVY